MNLLPCPFCKATEPTVCLIRGDDEDLYPEGGNPKQSAVICDFNVNGCGSISGFRDSEDEAIKLWNSALR